MQCTLSASNQIRYNKTILIFKWICGQYSTHSYFKNLVLEKKSKKIIKIHYFYIPLSHKNINKKL